LKSSRRISGNITFINGFLALIGAGSDKFRTLKGSTATGVDTTKISKRLTNLLQLTIDTSWWTRYRSRTQNPDIDSPVFQPAVSDLTKGQFLAIPKTDADTKPDKHIRAIANTAAFHFATIEQGGTSRRRPRRRRDEGCVIDDLKR